jgi:hypothetical protein
MNFDNEDFKKEFEEAFNIKIEEVTPKMLWFLTKFAKHVRLRCRNNQAFNSYMNRNFPNASFNQVSKVGNKGPYMGLMIVVNGQTFEDKDEE